jgi:hypothetical protein
VEMSVLRCKPVASTVMLCKGLRPAFISRKVDGNALCCRLSRREDNKTSRTRASNNNNEQNSEPVTVQLDIDKEVTRFARNAATTFAPRASSATKNPAYKGSTLYTVFEVQAWAALIVGGLLSFNVIFPSDHPDIARLIGMWSIWMFTVPSLRARDCSAPEKDALNTLFLAIPVLNVALPFVWKSFPFIFSADCLLLAAVYVWKGVISFPNGTGSTGGDTE